MIKIDYSDPNREPDEIKDDGIKYWYNEKGKKHRDGDLPAVIYADGYKVWYKNGKIHRDGDLPAAIDPGGEGRAEEKYWYKNGVRYISWKEMNIVEGRV